MIPSYSNFQRYKINIILLDFLQIGNYFNTNKMNPKWNFRIISIIDKMIFQEGNVV